MRSIGQWAISHEGTVFDFEYNAIFRLRKAGASAYSGQFNPVVPHIFALSSDTDGLSLYDTRNLKTLVSFRFVLPERYYLFRKLVDLSRLTERGCMYSEWNSTGQRIAVNLFKDYPIVIDVGFCFVV